MLTPVWAGRFRRDVKRLQKRGYDLSKLKEALTILVEQMPLPERFSDHPLRGD